MFNVPYSPVGKIKHHPVGEEDPGLKPPGIEAISPAILNNKLV